MCKTELTCRDYDRLITSMGIANAPDSWRQNWNDSLAIEPEAILQPELIDQIADLVPLPVELIRLIREAFSAVRTDPDLSRLACLWHHVFFVRDLPGANTWPLPGVLPDHLRPIFPIVVLVTGLPSMLEIHRRLNVPKPITSDCLLNIPLWAEHYRKANGHYGFEQIGWLQHSFQGRLFRLGRLEFRHGPSPDSFHVYRNNATGESIALLGDGTRVRRDGLVDGTNGVTDDQAWTATLIESDGIISGYPISCDGRAAREQTALRLKDWSVMLAPGVGAMEVHIPEGDKMLHEDCIESYRAAIDFFTEHFPEKQFRGFTCNSWLLDPELQRILPAESNIVRFQREFYLIPIPADDIQTFSRVFGSKPEDLSKAPRETSLQRAILAHIAAGNQMRRGFGFMPACEIGRDHKYYRAATITE